MVSAYHVRPTRGRRGWHVELEGAWGHESRRSEHEARELARLLAKANRPALVVVHGEAGEVRAKLLYVGAQDKSKMCARWRPG